MLLIVSMTSGKKKVTIIGMDGCPHCADAKEFLDKNHIDYTYIDALDEKNEKYVKDTDVVPKICIDSELKACILGFDERKLKKMLDIKK
jgi:glutaredoxin